MSLTNRAILELLTPEREKELLKLLISKRKYWVLVKESEDSNGIMNIYLSLDDAVQELVNDACKQIKDFNESTFDDDDIRLIKHFRHFSYGDHDEEWRIYEFPTESPEIENK